MTARRTSRAAAAPGAAAGRTEGGLRLAIVGSESLRGREIRNALGGGRFPVRSLEFYDPDVAEEYSRLTEFRNEPKVVHHLDPHLLEGLDLVFLSADPATNRALGEEARGGRFRALDLRETFNADPAVPLVVAGLNDRVVRARPPLMANPHPVTIFLAHLFAALDAAELRPRRAVSVALQPASAYEEAGIQELVDQSAALLNGASVSKKVFKEQAAFNVLASPGKPGADGFTPDEARIAGEVRRVLERPDLPLSLSIVQVPVFHTYGVMTWLELDREARPADLAAAFRGRAPFRPAESGRPASAASVAGSDTIAVGPVKVEPPPGRGAWVWMVADNLTAGSAVNALGIARALLDSPPVS